jgi:succinate-semialdehyde dehydrogenase/glutarate-semialdehyde dehydrogenase
MKFQSVNPYTEEIIAEFGAHTLEGCQLALNRARSAFERWRELSLATRTRPLRDAAVVLRSARERYARDLSRETGNPIRRSRSEIDRCARLFEYCAETAGDALADQRFAEEPSSGCVAFEPLGVMLGITRWDSPFWQIFRFAAPALVAGNVCIVKHAPNVPMAALEAERIMEEAGFPRHVFQTLLIDVEATARLVESESVAGVWFTGGRRAGGEVAKAAARGFKEALLELCGADPFIVLEDADLEAAAEAAVQGESGGSGLACPAPRRFVVLESVAEEFVDRLTERLRSLKVGDPMKEDTDVGPMPRQDFVDALQCQMEDAGRLGADIRRGPEIPDGLGFFFRPAVLAGVTPEMKVATEEVRGPVAAVLTARNEAEAGKLANAAGCGPGASIWSADTDRADRLARRVRAATVAINAVERPEICLPTKGLRKSGFAGRFAHDAVKQFVMGKRIVTAGNRRVE